ncbi:sulfatase-like hydrolase/transferase [Myxococcota bacterium]
MSPSASQRRETDPPAGGRELFDWEYRAKREFSSPNVLPEEAVETGPATTVPDVSNRRWFAGSLLLVFTFNVLVTSLIHTMYLGWGTRDLSTLGVIAVGLGLVSNAIILNTVVMLPVLLLTLAIRRKWVVIWVAPLLFGLLQIVCYLDTVLYDIFRFHFNGFVLNFLLTPGASDSITLGRQTCLSLLGVAALVVALEFLFALILLPRVWSSRLSEKLGRRRLWLAACGLICGLVVADKSLYTVGDLYEIPEVTRIQRMFPLYQPLILKGFVSTQLGMEISPGQPSTNPQESGRLDYPRKTLSFTPTEARPNIVIAVVEGGRFDMLQPSVMPHLDRWSRSHHRFERHHSAGNSSRFGVFGLFYGIYGSYWHSFNAERRPPVLIGLLKEMGYEFFIASCTNLNFPEFKQTVFKEVVSDIRDSFPAKLKRVERDRSMTDDFLEFLGNRSEQQPFLAFLFYDASHQPYLYPEEHKIFQNDLDLRQINYLGMSDRVAVAGMFNRYRNSLHYIDSQLNRWLLALESMDTLDDTLVFITGDHGEEFRELGYLGHNAAFHRYQSQVFMTAHLPGHTSRIVHHQTSHLDVVPTIFGYLGVKNPVSDYAQSTHLLNEHRPAFTFIAGWDEAAIVDNSSITVFGTEMYTTDLQVFDHDYHLFPDQNQARLNRKDNFLLALKGMRQFLK